ncbi:MAG: hypothetical protein ACPKPY_00355 [Nitrososphaeraceae archaeon]
MVNISINENETQLVIYALNTLAEMLEDGHLQEEDIKKNNTADLSLSSIYELKSRLESSTF